MHLPTAITLVLLLECAAADLITPLHSLVVASGWSVRGIAASLTAPRTILFDTANHLLVLEQGVGIMALTLAADGSESRRQPVLAYSFLTHGLALSVDGKFLYASSSNTVWRWNYNATSMTVHSQRKIVTGMYNTDHTTRTLLLSRADPGLLIVSRGSADNIESAAADESTGHAAINVFDLSAVPAHRNIGIPWSAGQMLAYGVRNEVGIAEDGAGRLWGVENSADELHRLEGAVETDVHQNNPGEKLNLFGRARNVALSHVRKWFGYPTCFSVWAPSEFPSTHAFKVGDWFVQIPTADFNDTTCTKTAVQPKLLFQAHSAPLDIKLGPGNDSNAYVTFHGSWDRTPPTGYKVVSVPGLVKTGAWNPRAALSSNHGYKDILTNEDVAKCPSACFRPVGLAWDISGKRLYVSSDASGEIVMLEKA